MEAFGLISRVARYRLGNRQGAKLILCVLKRSFRRCAFDDCSGIAGLGRDVPFCFGFRHCVGNARRQIGRRLALVVLEREGRNAVRKRHIAEGSGDACITERYGKVELLVLVSLIARYRLGNRQGAHIPLIVGELCLARLILFNHAADLTARGNHRPAALSFFRDPPLRTAGQSENRQRLVVPQRERFAVLDIAGALLAVVVVRICQC